MGLSKTNLFTATQNRASVLAKALGHPARIAIVEYLLQADTCINGDLVEEIGLAQATISQHLKELKKVGLIRGDVEGTSVCYCIDSEVWHEAQTVFTQLFQSFKCSDGCC